MRLMKLGLACLLAVTLVFVGTKQLQAATADVVFIVDESTSMDGEHAWLGRMIEDLDMALSDAGVTGRYGLVGFGAVSNHGTSGNAHIVGGSEQFGNAAEFSTATEGLVAFGTREDGYEAINFALDHYEFDPNAAVNFILVTDEDRDIDSSDTFDSILADLTTAIPGVRGVVTLNAIVSAAYSGDGGNGAIGIDNAENAYYADGFGSFFTTTGGIATTGDGNTVTDYVDLALMTGGAAWNLDFLSGATLDSESFTEAFVDIKVQEITEQIIPLPASLPLAGLGWMAMACYFWRKRRQKLQEAV